MHEKEKYTKAKTDLIKALRSFNELNQEQKMNLLNELSLATMGATLYEILELLRR